MMNFDNSSKMGKEAVDSMLASFAAVTKGFQQVAAEAAEYSRRSYEDGSVAVQNLVGAKSLDKALEIQTEFAKNSYEGLVAQATKMSEIYTNLAKEAYKPIEQAVSKSTS